MNKKGQTLVVFILLIPLFLLVAAFIVDKGYMVYKNIEMKNVTKDIIRIHLNKKELKDEEIIDIYKKNDIPTTKLNINIKEDKITISNTYYVDSIFGKIVNLSNYEVSCKVTGFLKDNKVVFE